MESDIAQIKILLWIILGLQIVFVVGNILCRLIGCGTDRHPDYNDLVSHGKFDEILSLTEKRLQTHPQDTDALYFRAKALQHVGLVESAKDCIRRLRDHDSRLAKVSEEWLASLEQGDSRDS